MQNAFRNHSQWNLFEVFGLFANGGTVLDAATLQKSLGQFGICVSNASELLPAPVDFAQFLQMMRSRESLIDVAEGSAEAPRNKCNTHLHSFEDLTASSSTTTSTATSSIDNSSEDGCSEVVDDGAAIAVTQDSMEVKWEEERKDYFIVRDGVKFAGTHLIIDLFGASHLDELQTVERAMLEAVTAAKATLLDLNLHYFSPNGGISGVAVLAESHISIHSWPEVGYAAMDIFTCGASEPHNAIEVLRDVFKPERIAVTEHLRGRQFPEPRRFKERLHDGLSLELETDNVVFEENSDLQKVAVFEHKSLGRVLMLDDIVQTTEKDEFVYHEAMTHIPIFAHGNVQKVLVIGGGDGGIVEEVLKHDSIQEVVLVEIDRSVVDLSTQYLPKVHRGVFENPRLRLVIEDGCKYVAETEERYDVIIVDSCDPTGPAKVLFTKEFYADCKRCMTPGGILVTQSGVPFYQAGELTATHAHMSELFTDAHTFLAPVPLYIGGFMAFGWGTDDASLRQRSLADLTAAFERANFSTDFYTPAGHLAAFALPPYVTRLLQHSA